MERPMNLQIQLKVPNLVVQGLYVDRVQNRVFWAKESENLFVSGLSRLGIQC